MATRRVLRCPGFISEDELLRLEIELAVEPLSPRFRTLGDPARPRALFISARDPARREEPPYCGERDLGA